MRMGGLMGIRRLRGVITIGLLAAGACVPSGEERRPQVDGMASVQASCALRLASDRPAPVQSLLVTPPHRIVMPDSVGLLGDVTWTADGSTMIAFDVMNLRVIVFDKNGRLLQVFGRRGNGPGEFVRSPNAWMGGTRLLATAQSFVVSDWRSTKVFSHNGRFLREIRVDSAPEAYNHDLHSALIGPATAVIGTSGKYRFALRDEPSRVRQELRRVDLASARVTATMPLVVENSWARVWPFDGYPPQQPYRDVHRRTWDVVGDSLFAVYPWQSPGICFVSFDGRIRTAFSVDARPLVTDDQERERVLRERFGDPDAPLPFTGESPRALYAGRWPDRGPAYLDVVGDPAGRAWALRRENGDRLVVDVYDSKSGYAGSFVPPARALPRRVRNNRALAIVNDSVVAVLGYSIPMPEVTHRPGAGGGR